MFDWLRNVTGRKAREDRTVLLYDPESQTVTRIPAAELAPGLVQARVAGRDEPVWVDPKALRQGDIKHPPFSESVRRELEAMYDILREVYPISFEQWEEGFRRDRTPEREIAIWKHIAQVYERFALSGGGVSSELRRDYFRLIITCSNAPRQNIWQVADLGGLSRSEAERVVAAFYGAGGAAEPF